jgi:hypothetical protein
MRRTRYRVFVDTGIGRKKSRKEIVFIAGIRSRRNDHSSTAALY